MSEHISSLTVATINGNGRGRFVNGEGNEIFDGEGEIIMKTLDKNADFIDVEEIMGLEELREATKKPYNAMGE